MNKKKSKSSHLLLPSILALGFIPLIVHLFYYENGLTGFDWFPVTSGQSADYFLAWKMIAIILTGAVMTAVLLFRHFRRHEKMKFENAFYLLMVYGIFAAMSGLFSHYRHWAMAGCYEMFESMWVILAYLVFCYYTYQYVSGESQIQSLLKWAGIGILLLTVIGVFQFLGLDFYQSTAGRMLITNPANWNSIDQIEFAVPKHTVYASLYNQNFLSFYCGIIIPVIAALFTVCKKKSQKAVLVIAEILAVLCLIGAQSSSGWMALGLAVFIVAFILMSRKKKTLVAACIGTTAVLVTGIAACVLTPLGNKVATTLAGTDSSYALRAIDTTNDCIEMDINGNILRVSYDVDEQDGQIFLSCTDDRGQELAITPSETNPSSSILQDPAYLGCTITPVMYQDMLAVNINLEEHDWGFTKTDEGSYCIINQAGKLEQYRSPEFANLFHDNALNGRGHIWNGIIPILGKYTLIGSGANTFLFAYPQNDYIYREYNGMQNMFDVKAHCLYLQQWVENGLPALLALLGFFLWYMVRCIRIFRKADLKDPLVRTGIGIFTGLLTYMIVGLANDSNVCTAPVFWVMLGLGMAVNRIIVEKQGLFPVSVDHSEPEAEEIPSVQPVKKSTKKKSRRERKNGKR